MALGGGTFTNQNKVLPGSYINFVSCGGVRQRRCLYAYGT